MERVRTEPYPFYVIKKENVKMNKYAELRRTLFEIDVVTVDGKTFITLTAEASSSA